MKTRPKSLIPTESTPHDILLWSSIACLFLVVHATQDRLGAALATVGQLAPVGMLDTKALLAYAPSIKGLFFLFSCAYLIVPIVRDARTTLSSVRRPQFLCILLAALGTMVLLGLLVFPHGNASMGSVYADRSTNPFEQHTGWYYKRLLMPAIAHMLFFRGGWLYYAFGVVLSTFFLAAAYTWMRNRTPLPFWQFVSLCTCSFAIFPFQFAGYPDILVFCCFILVMSERFGQPAKLSLLILALLTHEASLFMGLVLAWRFLDRRHFVAYLLSLSLYGFIWLGSYQFQLARLLSSHNVGGMSCVEWVIQKPSAALLGLFIGFKAMWLLLALACVISFKRRQWDEAGFMAASICTALLMIFLGVDTSRLVGFAFPGLFVAIQSIRSHLEPPLADRMLSLTFLLNLLIPSFYSSLNVTIIFPPGLYLYYVDVWERILSATDIVAQFL